MPPIVNKGEKMSNISKPSGKPEERVIARLNAQVYKKLEESLPAPTPGAATTDIQAGFLLGVQHVLKKLRDGYVISSD